MSFLLPAAGSAAREAMGDLPALVAMLSPERRYSLPHFHQALCKGRRFMESADHAASRVNFVCWGNCNVPKQHGKVVLISVGRRGGWKLEHVFGDGR